jgi:serine/threonine-protein kinase
LGSQGFTRTVVIKRPLREYEDDHGIEEMLRREAQVLSLLNHPNVVQVYDFDEINGKQYLVLEAVEGLSAARLTSSLGVVPVDVAVYIAVCTAEGLHAAHELKNPEGASLELVHRDVSPDNILLDWQGHVKVADFGIAVTKERSRLTAPGSVKGKFSFMAPEQIRGDEIDRRSDVYALGATLYKMIAGHHPFHKRQTDASLMYAVLHEEVPPLPNSIPPKLSEVIMRALAKKPGDRPQTAAELAAMLTSACPMGSAAGLKQLLATHFPPDHAERHKFTRLVTQEQRASEPTRPGRPSSVSKKVVLPRQGASTHNRRTRALSLAVAGLVIAGALGLAYGVGVSRSKGDSATSGVEGAAPVTASPAISSEPRTDGAKTPPAEVPIEVAGAVPMETAVGSSQPVDPGDATGSAVKVSKSSGAGAGRASPRAPPPKRQKEPVGANTKVAFSGTSGCLLLLNGRELGPLAPTPKVIDSLAPGAHRIRCKGGPLALDFERAFTVLEGEAKSLTLEPQRATLVVKVAPWGEVKIDGKPAGATPLEPQSLYEGRHWVEAIHPSGARARKEVVLAGGESQTVRLILDVQP